MFLVVEFVIGGQCFALRLFVFFVLLVCGWQIELVRYGWRQLASRLGPRAYVMY